MNIPWWGYVILAGLAWGTYVPIIFFGGQMLSPLDPRGNPLGVGGRLASILCVGIAYFVMAVVIPVALMSLRDDAQVKWASTGLVFSALAGVMGAIGAICVIFASKAATDTARSEFQEEVAALTQKMDAEPDAAKKATMATELAEFQKGQKRYIASYRIYIAPLIFCLAPLINTLMSLVWHPDKDAGWAQFHLELPSWHMPLGILFMALGTFLVLYSKEAAEANKPAKPPAAPQSAKPAVPAS